jgi:pyruvate dehydrogenase E2 component (dihydrolipoamide acetyltransferase)
MGTFRMPSLGADMERGTVTEWLIQPGDTVRRGDVVAVVETEKSAMDVEIFEDGVVDRLLVAVGEEAAVGAPLALVVPAGAPPATPPATPAAQPAPSVAPPMTSPVVRHLAERLGVDTDRLVGSGPGGKVTRADVEHNAAGHIRSSPLARRRATELGMELGTLPGTGPGGAVTAGDVERAAQTGPAVTSAAPTEPPARTGSMRHAIATLMSRSQREVPHYYLSATIDMQPTISWLADVNADRPPAGRLLPVAALLKATAMAARTVPELNGFWIDDGFRQADRIHLGTAINLRSGGLVAPAIHDADLLTVDEIMARLRDLVTRARTGHLRAREMADPTITVTSLGDQGAESVLGMIYPPQVALIGFGRIVERPWACQGMLTVRPVVTATLAADHRASDGHRGSLLLTAIDHALSHPEKL